ncbi:hypothetical protein [Sorangium sp. So ce590]|uniref:hypothetical protein n=1 Tax=unclassified Sorangium TaxID=2621164 RepID=UPI003F60FC92
MWCERILRGLPTFAWACSLRTFAYTIARNAAKNHARDRRVRPSLGTTELSAIEQQVCGPAGRPAPPRRPRSRARGITGPTVRPRCTRRVT